MEIVIKINFRGQDYWQSKKWGVILVEKEEDIDPLFKLLLVQDEYWEHYKKLIKVAPKEVESKRELELMCEYCGKTDIYKFKEIQERIPFIAFQIEDRWGQPYFH